MKKNVYVTRILFATVTFCLVLACLTLFSCKSTDVPSEEAFHPATSLEDLIGKWTSENGDYEYPFVVANKKYIRIASAQTDDTEIWNDYAETNEIPFADLWKKRFSYVQYVYAPEGYMDRIPVSDSNGTEFGRKLTVHNGRIYSRLEMLVPEKILIANLRFFLLSSDGQSFIENKVFYLASDFFEDLTSDGTVYNKKPVLADEKSFSGSRE